MKQFFKRDRILIVIVIIGLLVSLVPIASRVKAEEDNKTYDLLLDYTSLKSMQQQSDMSEEQWLDFFRNLGIKRVVLGESTLKSISSSSKIAVFAGSVKDMQTHHGWNAFYPDIVTDWILSSTASDALVIAEDAEYFDWIMSALKNRVDDLSYRLYQEDDCTYLYLTQQKDGTDGDELLKLPLGILPETEKLFTEHGYEIIPRTSAVDGLNGEKFAEAFISELKRFNSEYFINSGDSLLGYDSEEGKKVLWDYLKESGVSVGLYEQNDQSQNIVWDGTEELLLETGYNGIRIFNEWSYIQFRYAYCGYEGPEEITNSLFRAIAERNCRAVLFKMILEPDNDISSDADEAGWTYITDTEDYEKLINDLDSRLSVLGYKSNSVKAMELDNPDIIILIAESAAVAAAWIILADMFLFIGTKLKYILFILAAVCFAGLALLKPESFKLILCMAGGIAMPSLAAAGLSRTLAEIRREETELSLGKLICSCLCLGIITVLCAFGGSLFAASALSELSYILEINLYRGVKLMQLIPIGFFGLMYILVFAYEETGAKKAVLDAIGPRGEKERTRRLCSYAADALNRPMKLSWFAAAVAVAVAAVFMLAAGVYYIYRTGNASDVSDTELAFRNMLENLLIARPRTKEILIGWPCMMLFIWSLRRKMNFLPVCFGLMMSIGLVSIVNTFLHIRTPFLLSLLRTGWGILFGFIIGIIAVLAAELIYKFIRKLCLGENNA